MNRKDHPRDILTLAFIVVGVVSAITIAAVILLVVGFRVLS